MVYMTHRNYRALYPDFPHDDVTDLSESYYAAKRFVIFTLKTMSLLEVTLDCYNLSPPTDYLDVKIDLQSILRIMDALEAGGKNFRKFVREELDELNEAIGPSYVSEYRKREIIMVENLKIKNSINKTFEETAKGKMTEKELDMMSLRLRIILEDRESFMIEPFAFHILSCLSGFCYESEP